MRRKCVCLAVLCLLVTSCASWQETSRVALDAGSGGATLVYAVIEAQASFKPGSIPDHEMVNAANAYKAVMAARVAGLEAIAAGDRAAADLAVANMGLPLAELGRIKAQHCPFKDKDDED